MKRNLVLTPGPIHIPPEVCAALGKPIIHHRTPQFQQALKEAQEGLQYVFQTKNDIYLFPSSGTGGMEAAVANLLSPGDKAITVEGGKFGERWTELCNAYGAKPDAISVKWGTAVNPEEIKKRLDTDKDIKAVFITLNETSTGVVTDVKAVAEVVNKTKAVLVVDAISGLGAVDCQMDNWGVDVLVSASHKGFMPPPGLGFIAANDKAFALVEKATSPRYYFDLRKYKKTWAKTDTPFTPAIGIVIALLESLKFFKERGLDNLLAYYARLAKGTRAAAKAMNLKVYADESCVSTALTPILLPENIDGGKVVKTMRDAHGISIAGGQGDLKGKIVRIAHMGSIDEYDVLTGLSCLEKVLKELGHDFTLGAGVAAAQEVFNQ